MQDMLLQNSFVGGASSPHAVVQPNSPQYILVDQRYTAQLMQQSQLGHMMGYAEMATQRNAPLALKWV
jgi:hypothetical protein